MYELQKSIKNNQYYLSIGWSIGYVYDRSIDWFIDSLI